MSDRPQKISFAQMRNNGVRGLLIYCSDYKCSHLITMSGDGWPDDLRLSDIEHRFVCEVCGKRGTPTCGRTSIGTESRPDDGVLLRRSQRLPAKPAVAPWSRLIGK